jgi:integral membrane protein
MNSVLNRFRLIAFIEGVSYLVLLFVAMPLKYWAGFPLAVSIVGMIHGILFVLFFISLAEATLRLQWTFIRVVLVFLSSLIPFGTFFLEVYWLRNEARRN